MSGRIDRRSNYQRGGNRSGNRRPARSDTDGGDEAPESGHVMDEQSKVVVKMFESFQRELDDRYDRMERIVKRSRDITIESKRVIFLLHRITKDEGKDSIFEDASKRLQDICCTNFKAIAMELRGEDPFHYLRPYSPGLQEFIEAALYFKFLKEERLLTHVEIQEQMVFEIEGPADGPKSEGAATAAKSVVTLHIPYTEYVLGIADFTGELMRKCINSIGYGDQQKPFDYLPHLRTVLSGFQGICGMRSGSRELTTKMNTLKQSVEKVENACYAIVVRRKEVPDYKLPNIAMLSSAGTDDYNCDAF